ncbi:MAG: hypothetical protein PWR07_1666 [Bacillota bacterium]|nr:hypothetical protein [Bacillota bacterium]
MRIGIGTGLDYILETAPISPKILRHLSRLTDDTGLLEHACGSIPNPAEGYTADDNARGIIACCLYRLVTGQRDADGLADRYLQFLLYCRRTDGRIHNAVRYDRVFEDEVGSEDAHGRAAWALGYASRFPWRPGIYPAVEYLRAGLWPHLERLESPRAVAYTLLGAAAACGLVPTADIDPSVVGNFRRGPENVPAGDEWRRLTLRLAPRLADRLSGADRYEKKWITPRFTYDDARLVEALIRASALIKGAESTSWMKTGIEGLTFMWEEMWSPEHDCLILPGNHGFIRREKARRPGELIPEHYDQQPLDAAALVDACLAAYGATGEQTWLRHAGFALEWFYGRNLGRVALADPIMGGCYDGLTPTGPNLNMGAESTLAHLMARLGLAPHEKQQQGRTRSERSVFG